MNCLEIGSMLLLIRKGYNSCILTNYDLLDYMIEEELIDVVECKVVITNKGNNYLDKLIETKYLLLLRYLSPDPKEFDKMMINQMYNQKNENVKVKKYNL